jgi:hypothetical protein
MDLRIRGALVQAHCGRQCQQFGRGGLARTATSQIARQGNRAESHPDQATDDQADRLDHTANFTIAPLAQGHGIPAIDAIATRFLELVKPRRTIFEVNPLNELPALLGVKLAEHANCVLALDLVAWMHEPRRQIAPGCQEQEAARVVVESSDRNPASRRWPWQIGKDARATLGIILRDDLTSGLVIEQHRALDSTRTETNRGAIDLDLIGSGGAVAQLGHSPIDRNPPRRNEVIDFTTRPTAVGGQQFLDANGLTGHDFQRLCSQWTARAAHRAGVAAPSGTTGTRGCRRELGCNALASRLLAAPASAPRRVTLAGTPGFGRRALIARAALLQRARRRRKRQWRTSNRSPARRRPATTHLRGRLGR